MSYTANTPEYYNAVIAGANGAFLAGQSGTNDDAEAPAATIPANAAQAIAQEVDTILGVLTPTVAKAWVLIELTGAWMLNRNPTANPVYAVPGSYNAIALAIVAAWTATIGNLQ
jgi:hypothetical protein